MLPRKLSGSLSLLAIAAFASSPAYAQSAKPAAKTTRPTAKPAQTRTKPTEGAPTPTDAAQTPAAEEPTEGVSKTKADPGAAPATAAQTDFSSGAIRARRSLTFSAQYTPLSDFVLQAGGAFGFNKGRYFQFGTSILLGSKDLKNNVADQDDANLDKLTVSGFALDAYTRLYPMKGTFSFKLGVGYRQADMKYRIASKSSSVFVEGTLKVSSLVVPVFVGNHWSLDNGIFFGADWLGAYFALTGSTKTSTTSNIDEKSVNEIQKDLQELGDDLAKRTSVTLAVLSVGYQF